MNELAVKEIKTTLDSREVAEMLGKEHSMLLREIDGSKDGKTVGIIPTLEKANFAVSNYFIPSAYQSGTREYKCYKVTKLGCEVLGNKQQGEKGILFTAKYVKRFNEMEQGQIPQLSKLSKELQAIFAIDQKQQQFDNRLTHLENNMVVDNGQAVTINKLVSARVKTVCGGSESTAYADKIVRAQTYRALWRDYKGYFNITSYHNTLKKDFEVGKRLIQNWTPTGSLLREIQNANNQLQIAN